MSFQEKSAWIMALALIATSVMCTWSVYDASMTAGELVSPSFGIISTYTLFLVVTAVTGQVVISIRSPKQASTPADEREINIERRTGYTSGWIMGVGVIISLSHYLHWNDGDMLFYMVLGSMAVAAIVDYVYRIVLHRSAIF